jgi:hypothetical protein
MRRTGLSRRSGDLTFVMSRDAPPHLTPPDRSIDAERALALTHMGSMPVATLGNPRPPAAGRGRRQAGGDMSALRATWLRALVLCVLLSPGLGGATATPLPARNGMQSIHGGAVDLVPSRGVSTADAHLITRRGLVPRRNESAETTALNE